MNQSAIDRGFMRSTSLKKYLTTIQKNQSTSQDDVFIKPDSSKVTGMKFNSYDKLNEKGYAPAETVIVNGDIILGKVSPITPVGNSNKTFKDSSEVYKSHVPGVIDRVWTDIYNNEGYEMRKVRVRSERIPHIGDKMCCYSSDHDVLTSSGWIAINKITNEHKIASLVNGNILEYVNPIDLQKYNYEGKMYIVDSNQVNLKVTPNHRMYIGDRNGRNYKIELAEEIYGKRRKYLKNVNKIRLNYDNIPKELKLNEFREITKFRIYDNEEIVFEFDIEPWLKLFGIWIAEGSLNGQRSIHFAVHKQRVRKELEDSCEKLRIKLGKYNEGNGDTNKNCYAINSVKMYKYFESYYGKSINKKLPNWVWILSKKQCQILINAMMLGDGHIMKGTITMRYDTSSVKLRDDLQILCLHAGYSANWYLKYEAGHTTNVKSRYGKEINENITSTVDSYRLTIVTKQNNPLVNKNIKAHGKDRLDRWEDFKGQVYCCTVPGDGVIYVRRNGIPIWCGNSRHGQKGTCGITLPQGDMPFTSEGITPSILLNPCAIPSRMTLAQLIECLVGKLSALEGHESDGTPFNELDLEVIKDRLESLGYERNGYEYLYNGMTGKKLRSEIFIGPTYYQRLKHMVSDKIHSRARGSRTLLTRQPLEGRSRDGRLA